MRRILRGLGTAMVVVGLGLLVWVVVVWRWEDPLTSLYTAYQQRSLSSSLDRKMDAYKPVAVSGASLAAVRRTLRAEAVAYRRQVHSGEAIGRIKVRAIGVNMVLVDGTDHDPLKRGPGLHRGTFMPGEGELIYIAGHRTTYAAPFSHIDRLRRGDLVTLEMPYGTFVYAVTGHRIVRATATWVLRSHHREVVALQACHPRFFASHRYIVYGKAVRVIPRGGRAYRLSANVSPTATGVG